MRQHLAPSTAMWLLVIVALAVLAVGITVPATAQSDVRLVVYSALETDQLDPFKQAFEHDNPGIAISWVRDSTGIITARLLAEKDNPRADVIWGVAATSMLIFEEQNMLHPYTPRGAENLKPAFRSEKRPMTWTGMDAFLGVICYNTAEAAKRGLRRPSSWRDLLNPVYKGQIVMPNPASSGTGYLTIAAWHQLMGDANAWTFSDRLHDNMAVYTHSGSAPCNQAATGEYTVGISFDMRAARLKAQGAPIDIVLPREGVGWDMEATAIARGTRNLSAAQRLADWAVSRKAMELYSNFYAVVAMSGVGTPPAYYPVGAESLMVKNDFGWMAKSRDRILTEWTRRYDAKSAPRR
jgi:iron(III) transport system substrate-binding protein